MASNAIHRRTILGRGWRFPIRPVDGRLSYVEDEDGIEQAIALILSTAPRERLMRASFGAGLPDSVFASNSALTRRLLADEVTRALREWEPRIEVERVEASGDASEPNVLRVAIDYVVRRTNVHYNRVFPFYLDEGA